MFNHKKRLITHLSKIFFSFLFFNLVALFTLFIYVNYNKYKETKNQEIALLEKELDGEKDKFLFLFLMNEELLISKKIKIFNEKFRQFEFCINIENHPCHLDYIYKIDDSGKFFIGYNYKYSTYLKNFDFRIYIFIIFIYIFTLVIALLKLKKTYNLLVHTQVAEIVSYLENIQLDRTLRFKFSNTFDLFEWELIQNQIVGLVDSLNSLEEKIKDKTAEDIATQVSHDIRSPLAALNMTLSQLQNLPEQQRITLRAATNRINDIANTLLSAIKQKNVASSNITDTSATNGDTVELLPALLDNLVSEKRTQYRDKFLVNIDADFNSAYGAFAKINRIEFSRVISNLINNAIEALPKDGGVISLKVHKQNDSVIIYVTDNGSGIPSEVLEKVGEKGLTYGKSESDSGSGLGLYHAKKTIEGLSGKFYIESTLGIGTRITIKLIACAPPSWFVESLLINENTTIVSIDDDMSVHNIWKEKFNNIQFEHYKPKHKIFTSTADFKSWTKAHLDDNPLFKSNCLFLVDFEFLNQHYTGLDLIEDAEIAKHSILVTSRYEEYQIRERCEKLGVRLIPKGMSSLVPIKY